MKTLTLLRHARSGWGGASERDFDRTLDQSGRVAAQAVGRALREHQIGFDAIRASPAIRVVETLAEIAGSYGGPIDPVFDERLYLASVATLLGIVRETGDMTKRLLIVGHNPAIGALAGLLASNDPSVVFPDPYPTAGLAEIELDVETWREFGAGSGRSARFIGRGGLEPIAAR